MLPAPREARLQPPAGHDSEFRSVSEALLNFLSKQVTRAFVKKQVWKHTSVLGKGRGPEAWQVSEVRFGSEGTGT